MQHNRTAEGDSIRAHARPGFDAVELVLARKNLHGPPRALKNRRHHRLVLERVQAARRVAHPPADLRVPVFALSPCTTAPNRLADVQPQHPTSNCI
eukprot:1196643-Rhodomonas_salina.1